MSAVLEDLAPAAPAAAAPPVAAADPLGLDAAQRAQFARDVLAGLAQPHKSIPCTWLYDHRGSELFERITRVPEYYPTRNETWILERCAAQIAQLAGPHATVIELGAGSGRKTPLLLDALEAPAAYVPIDISAQFLAESVATLRARFPSLDIEPVVADFTRLTALPQVVQRRQTGRCVVFFPGSTIGNFTPEQAIGLLDRVGQAAGRDALLVIGADSTHDPAVLIPAYDDREGVTAAFDLNLLARINRELGADFNLSAFRHEARWNAAEQRVEMHLVSLYTQRVTLLGRSFRIAVGESIHTESSYKYGLVKFQAIAHRAGWSHRQLWMDGQSRFAVHVLERWR
jgi:L-histidine N-alpha-methyltransferase